MAQLLPYWKIWIGGRRKGANVTIRNTKNASQNDVSGTVIGWMTQKGNAFEHCSRQKAKYCLIRRWSYTADTMGMERVVLVPLTEAPNE